MERFSSLLSAVIKKRGAARLAAVNCFIDFFTIRGADKKLVALRAELQHILEDGYKN